MHRIVNTLADQNLIQTERKNARKNARLKREFTPQTSTDSEKSFIA